jgi:hypothetical protein
MKRKKKEKKKDGQTKGLSELIYKMGTIYLISILQKNLIYSNIQFLMQP